MKGYDASLNLKMGTAVIFQVKAGAETLDYWPPVFEQGEGFK